MDMIKEIWESVEVAATPMETWQAKIIKVRQHLRGWAKHTSGLYKKEKKKILDKLDELDKKAEIALLTPQEVDLKHWLKNRLVEMLREEEINWYQWAKVKELLEGDSNTKYFQLVANGKHRKTRIYQLQDGDHIISGDDELKKYITTYYKGLFGPPENNDFDLDETRIHDVPQVTNVENEILTSEFTETEVRDAIFQIEHNKAPGPDGFPAEFYQAFWDTIKSDLMALFSEFHKGDLSLYSLNFGTIILLPNCREAIKIQ